MLRAPTPFPYVGSYALLEDHETALVRILARRISAAGEMVALVGFPLRDGAAGNREVPEASLIDATPLTPAEAREFHDLDRHLAGRSPASLRRSTRLKAQIARRDSLYRRIVYGPILDRLLRFARSADRIAA